MIASVKFDPLAPSATLGSAPSATLGSAPLLFSVDFSAIVSRASSSSDSSSLQ